jgi:hypothetical protein
VVLLDLDPTPAELCALKPPHEFTRRSLQRSLGGTALENLDDSKVGSALFTHGHLAGTVKGLKTLFVARKSAVGLDELLNV